MRQGRQARISSWHDNLLSHPLFFISQLPATRRILHEKKFLPSHNYLITCEFNVKEKLNPLP